MNDSKSSMILIGIGGAGSAAARGVSRAFGPGLRYVLADTDAATGAEGEPFVLSGTLSAGGNELRSVTVEVFAGDEPQGEPLLRGTLTGRRLACLLEEGALKEALPFETLGEGDFCLRICTSVAACSSTDGENLLWEEQSLELLTLGFAVEAGPEVDELS